MEAPQQQHQHQHQQQQPNDQDGGSGKSSSFLCRQSSTRWTPTTDQIRILKDLYYNNGIRSPTAEQIQKISARLRQYGKIEGKNVFYWFQNHKARERQKKRFTAEIPVQRGVWRSSEDTIYNNNNKYPNINHGITSPSTSSPGVHAVGHMGNYSYGSVAMEKSFRDCSISTCGNGDGSMGQNFAWVGVDPSYPSTYPFLDKRKAVDETLDHEDQDQDQEHAPEIETLPLFPMHGEDISGFCNIKTESSESYYTHDWFRSENNMGGAAARASLELSLNSYCGRSTEAP